MSKRIIAGALAGAVLASTMAPMGVYADSPEVNIWVSKVNATDSGMEKGLEKQTPVHFGSGDSASTRITPTRRSTASVLPLQKRRRISIRLIWTILRKQLLCKHCLTKNLASA